MGRVYPHTACAVCLLNCDVITRTDEIQKHVVGVMHPIEERESRYFSTKDLKKGVSDICYWSVWVGEISRLCFFLGMK